MCIKRVRIHNRITFKHMCINHMSCYANMQGTKRFCADMKLSSWGLCIFDMHGRTFILLILPDEPEARRFLSPVDEGECWDFSCILHLPCYVLCLILFVSLSPYGSRCNLSDPFGLVTDPFSKWNRVRCRHRFVSLKVDAVNKWAQSQVAKEREPQGVDNEKENGRRFVAGMLIGIAINGVICDQIILFSKSLASKHF